MLDELKQLHAALDASEVKLRNDNSTIGELLNKLQSRKPRMETLLNHIFAQKDKSFGSDGWDEEYRDKKSMECLLNHIFAQMDKSFGSDRWDEEYDDNNSKEGCYFVRGNMDAWQANVASGSPWSNHNIDKKGKGSGKSKKNPKGKAGQKRK
ncbi:hypothetical protein P3X46_016984 [Hevea brasiliensis]|uniref:Uncharacterized protein n=1 Tax=Hevea brasiliensis TaxID=3981 RepID=A0ABQ9M2K5_HEVBR|nr:uncharacterized protein LOC131183265 [Hevea brasiliensis]KAJ9173893.1 hypothetical protein P3X46_016984 [Hevea brasiliensis]